MRLLIRLICVASVACVAIGVAKADEPASSGVALPLPVAVIQGEGGGGGVQRMIQGEVVKVSREGVLIKVQRDGEASQSFVSFVIPWYEIRSLEGAWVIPAEFAEYAKKITIGYARRQRGDLQGGARMYSSVAKDLIGSDSELAREVFDGLLQESLVRGDFYDAFSAMVALQSAGARPATIDGFDSRYRVHEGAALLPSLGTEVAAGVGHRLTELANVLEKSGETEALILQAFEMVNADTASSDQVVDLLLKLDEQRRIDVEARLGIELYSKMLSAMRHPDAESREEARRWLMARSRVKTGTWIEAWCRLGVGESLMLEGARGGSGGKDATQGEELVSQGIVELVHVIVRFDEEFPVLARWARSRAALGLGSVGRFEEAAVLGGELGTLKSIR